jgi:hypothetical protein
MRAQTRAMYLVHMCSQAWRIARGPIDAQSCHRLHCHLGTYEAETQVVYAPCA